MYVDPTCQALQPTLVKGEWCGPGCAIVAKSCNRCSRFLPIDIENERNTLAYSNHCVSRAPCEHSAFSRYLVVSSEANSVAKYQHGNKIHSYYGHQLECKVCKKFFVNAPLNPLRNSTQHREDSLRRRAFEVLVSELLGRDWIYHKHRLESGSEFDVFIWEKFKYYKPHWSWWRFHGQV